MTLLDIHPKIREVLHQIGKNDGYKYLPVQHLLKETVSLRDSSYKVKNLPNGAIELSLSQAKKSYGGFLKKRSRIILESEKDPFALINNELHQEGLFLYFPPNTTTENPLEITIMGSVPRVVIYVGKKVKLDVVIHCKDPSLFTSRLFDITMEEGCCATFYSDLDLPDDIWFFENVRGTLKKDSTLKYLSITQGSKTIRQDFSMKLEGENAETCLQGVSLLNNAAQSHTFIHMEHVAPNTRSHQHFKGVGAGKSRTSFEGKIYVHKEAQQTDAYQLNNQLLLGEKATAFSKPNLEIFADDVKASHGATVSQLSPDEVFYLKTRGLSKELAKQLLVKGFIKEILISIPFPSIQREWLAKIELFLNQFTEVID